MCLVIERPAYILLPGPRLPLPSVTHPAFHCLPLPPSTAFSYAPSLAESHWPEELLQDLADLGPDGVPRMELLWEWMCPMPAMAEEAVACMAWNKASTPCPVGLEP